MYKNKLHYIQLSFLLGNDLIALATTMSTYMLQVLQKIWHCHLMIFHNEHWLNAFIYISAFMFKGQAIYKSDKLISWHKMLWPGMSGLLVPNLCIYST